MNRLALVLLTAVLCLAAAAVAFAQAPGAALTVVSAAPQGEVAALAQANEIRVVFSEPMVTLGRIPDRVRPSFFKVTPAIRGTFRRTPSIASAMWSWRLVCLSSSGAASRTTNCSTWPPPGS